MIRSVTLADAADIAEIYNYYITDTVITFEEEAVTAHEMQARIADFTRHHPWLVWEEDGRVHGYAYVHQWRERVSFRFSVEDSIYVRRGFERRGIGKALLEALLDALKTTDVHVVVAGITLPNEQSVALHEKYGFTKCAEFSNIGFKMNRWLSVGFWERIL